MAGRGGILRIDLTSGRISKEPVPLPIARKYLGGEGINAWLLWRHFLTVDPKIDPLSPDNVLIAGVGPLGATGLGLGTKTHWTFKSPLTNIYGDSSGGGFFGSNLRWAGYDHLVVTGRSAKPVYIWIKDDVVEIKEASHLWGKTVGETDNFLQEELGTGVETACIGPAGENKVRFASIVMSKHRVSARCGGGCVFGSKNLKAIVALGTKGVSIADKQSFFSALDKVVAGIYKDPKAIIERKRYGTLGAVRTMHRFGFISYNNSQTHLAPEEVLERTDGDWYLDHIAKRNFVPCSPGCATACGSWCTIEGHESEAASRFAGERGVRPEYGNWASFAGGCSIGDFPALVHLTNRCNEYGMDTFEAGMTVSFLMELLERNIISAPDVEKWMGGSPLPLVWGDWASVENVLDAMAFQNNKMGRLLKGGVYSTAKALEELTGTPVLKYANYGKGRVTDEQTVRGYPARAIACATSPIGSHHTKGLGIDQNAAQIFLGDPGLAEGVGMKLKKIGAVHGVAETLCAIGNSLGVCSFIVGGRQWDTKAIPLELLSQAILSVTGESISPNELCAGGERLANLAKAFNTRLGLRREDDQLCERWLKEPQLEGMAKGWKAEDYIEQAKDEYYDYRGWDKITSLPTRNKLEELDMHEVASILEEESGLVD